MKVLKLSLLIFFVFAFLVGLVILLARYLYWDSNDWPTLYRAIRERCGQEARCTLDLTSVYNTAWKDVVAFNDTGERDFKEKIVDRRLEGYQEFCQGLIFLDEQGNILNEEYSGCFEEFFSFNRQALVRFSFGDDNYFKVNRSSASVCVVRHEISGVQGDFYGFDEKLRRYFYEVRGSCSE